MATRNFVVFPIMFLFPLHMYIVITTLRNKMDFRLPSCHVFSLFQSARQTVKQPLAIWV